MDDIDAAIDWALKNMPVDRQQIYVVGTAYHPLEKWRQKSGKMASEKRRKWL